MRDFGSRHTLRSLLRASAARFGLVACGGTLLLTLAGAPAAAQQYISADRNVIVDYSALDRLGPAPAAAPALGAVQGYPYGYMPSPAYGYQPSAAPSTAPQSMLFVPKPFVPGPIAPIKPASTGTTGTTSVASAPTPPPAAAPSPQPLPPLVPSTASAAPAAPAPEPAPEAPAEAPAETAAATPEAPAVPAPPEPSTAAPETITPSPPEPEVSTNVAPPPEAPAAEAPAEPAETEAAEALPEPTEAEMPSAPAASETATPSAPPESAPAESEAATSETEAPAASETTQDEASQTAALPPAPAGDSVQIVFVGESAELPPDILPQLDALADKLLQDENLRLQLMAYASGTEDTASKARRISLSRALAVRAYLIGKGIRSTRMDVRALGNKVEGEPADRVDIVTQTP